MRQVSRRELLSAGALGAAAFAVTGCRSMEQIAVPLTVAPDSELTGSCLNRAEAGRLAGRLGFGHRPGDRVLLQNMGEVSFLERQLNPDSIAESEAMRVRVDGIEDSLPDDYGLLYEEDDHQLITLLAQSSLLRAVYSSRQLFERMVEFWSDHFNIYAFKSISLPQYTVLFNRTVIRHHALGSFSELLNATARSAAVLTYLDNDQNRKGGPNENYARELLELHTLGVHGGYSQNDVKNVAKCLTGWSIDKTWRPGQFTFNKDDHDTSLKQVLSKTISGSGTAEMSEVLDIVANHRSTALHIAGKLLYRFRGDNLPDHIDHVASVFGATGGDIKKLMRAVILDCGILDAPPILKRPFDFVTSALRVFDIDSECGPLIVNYLSRMGQPMYQWPRPDGFSDRSASWSACLSARWQFALDLSSGTLSDSPLPLSSLAPNGQAEQILAHVFPDQSTFIKHESSRTAIRDMSLSEAAALALLSPEFQWR